MHSLSGSPSPLSGDEHATAKRNTHTSKDLQKHSQCNLQKHLLHQADLVHKIKFQSPDLLHYVHVWYLGLDSYIFHYNHVNTFLQRPLQCYILVNAISGWIQSCLATHSFNHLSSHNVPFIFSFLELRQKERNERQRRTARDRQRGTDRKTDTQK